MAANLRGNLGLKSSPLAPTACKLSTQYLVLDHMTNHYNKIAKAKSAIDSKPPKSLSTSQKMRDRKNRERMVNSPRTRPVTSMSYAEANGYQDLLYDEPEDDEERLVHSIMKSTLLEKPKASNNATYGSASNIDTYDPETHITRQMYHTAGDMAPQRSARPRPSSARSIRSTHSLASSTSRALIPPTHDPAKLTYNGDVLDKRPHLFTEPDRPFTPRTLKMNHESRLKNSKCYNPPRPKSGGQMRKSVDEESVADSRRPKAQPRTRKQPRQDVSPEQGYSNQDLQETMETGQLSETMLMDITLRSRDGRHGQESSHNVPPLAISMDKDHMNWLQEQASKAEVRARSNGQLRSSLHSDDELHPVKNPRSADRDGTGLKQTIKTEAKKNPMASSSSRSLISNLSTTSWISQLLMEEDEEQKYLAFAKEVTDDVLSRGICSDSILHRVFENHIERRKHELDEQRLRKVIKDLRKDLGLRDAIIDNHPVASLSDVNYNNRASRETTHLSSSSHSGSAVQQNGCSSKEESLTFSQMNMDTSTTLEPLNVMTSHSEMSTTLDSTSTMKFGQTGEVFSTINSEATLEAEEAEKDKLNGDSGLTVTQALKQYQFNLTVKEASGDISTNALESEAAHSNGEKNSTGQSNKLERPATGERRAGEDEETRSDTSSIRAASDNHSQQSHRTRRRERFRKTKELENSSSAASQPGSEYDNRNHTTSDDMPSSEKSVIDVRLPSQNQDSAHLSAAESASVLDDGEVSVKSSASSQRPVVKPRTKVRKGSQPQEQELRRNSHTSDRIKSAAHEDEERGRDVQNAIEQKQDHSSSSAQADSGLSSAPVAAGHDDTLDDAPEVEKHAEDAHPEQVSHKQPLSKEASAEEVDEYEDDYEEDYDEDEGQGGSTHRTSDDDF